MDDIETDDLTRPQVHALLAQHLAQMHAQSPARSVHALDIERLPPIESGPPAPPDPEPRRAWPAAS